MWRWVKTGPYLVFFLSLHILCWDTPLHSPMCNKNSFWSISILMGKTEDSKADWVKSLVNRIVAISKIHHSTQNNYLPVELRICPKRLFFYRFGDFSLCAKIHSCVLPWRIYLMFGGASEPFHHAHYRAPKNVSIFTGEQLSKKFGIWVCSGLQKSRFFLSKQ